METSKRLTIFEGPDGGGKTSAAKLYAEATGARYVHLGSFNEVTTGLARLYVEAMMPALLGYQDVVMDRCWFSEFPYGLVYREGKTRLGPAEVGMLNRVAMRCGAVVVKCLPPLYTVANTFNSRRSGEMLDNDTQLAKVYELYKQGHYDLPTVHFDYEDGPLNYDVIDELRMPRHDLDVASAGNLGARVMIVGESFGAVKNNDPLQQYPFVSFSKIGCSQWLSHLIDDSLISEQSLYWVNSDQLKSDERSIKMVKDGVTERLIVALGETAYRRSMELYGGGVFKVDHPQYHKRFSSSDRDYALIPLLKEYLKYAAIFN